MKRRSQTDEEQSAERFTKLLARREACAKGAAKGRRLQHAGESERAREAKRSDEEGEIVSYECRRSHDLAALPIRSMVYLGHNPGPGVALNGAVGSGPSARPGRWAWQGWLSFAVAIAYNKAPPPSL